MPENNMFTLSGLTQEFLNTPTPTDFEGQAESIQPGFWETVRNYSRITKPATFGSFLGAQVQRNFGAKITVAEANKKYPGLQLPGNPTDNVGEDFARDQYNKLKQREAIDVLNQDNPNNNLLTGALGGIWAYGTDPAEWGLNVGLAFANPLLAASRFLGYSARAIPAATKVAQAVGTVAKNPIARRVAEDTLAGGISALSTYGSANYVQDERLFGEEGYGAREVIVDTVAGAVMAEGVHQLGRFAGKAIGKTTAVTGRTLKKVIDPTMAKVETTLAAMQGREPNLANMFNAEQIGEQIAATQDIINTKIGELDTAPRRAPINSARTSAEVFEQAAYAEGLKKEAAQMLSDAEKPVLEFAGTTDIVTAQQTIAKEIGQLRQKTVQLQKLAQDTGSYETYTTLAAETEKLSNLEEIYRNLLDTRKAAADIIDEAAAATKITPRSELDPEPQYHAVSFAEEPVIPKGGLKTRTVVNGQRFISPVPEDTVVSSQFGLRKSPKAGASSSHKGIDFALPEGTPFRASRAGVVAFSGKQKGYGNVIIIDHGNGMSTRYAHAKDGSIVLKKGAKVSEGQAIGQVGSTGNSTGPHLHFEVRKNGQAVDPQKWLKKGVELDPPPATRPLRPDPIPDDLIARGTPIDDAVAESPTMRALSQNIGDAIDTTIDDVVGAMIDPNMHPDTHIPIHAALSETIDTVSQYTGIPVEAEKITAAILRGQDRVQAFITAIDGKAPEDTQTTIKELWQILTQEVKRNTAKGKEFATKLFGDTPTLSQTPENLAKFAAYQEAVAEMLPQLYAVHRALNEIEPGLVTRELPSRVFMDMFGGEVSEFGRALVSDVPFGSNMPLYRLRKTLWDKLGREAQDLARVVSKIKEEGRVQRSLLDADDVKVSQLVQKTEDILRKTSGGKTPDLITADAITVVEQQFDQYFKSGLFPPEAVESKEKFLANVIAAMEEGRPITGLTDEQLSAQALTRIENEIKYTESMERIQNTLATCALKGFTNG